MGAKYYLHYRTTQSTQTLYFYTIVPNLPLSETVTDNTMTFDFQSHVQSLSVFENYLGSDLVIAVVKKNTTVFTAMSNVVKATPISSDTKLYKILKLAVGDFDIKNLILCPAERYLTVVGERNVVVVDTSEIRFSDRLSAVAEPFSFKLGAFNSDVKCVEWHPASARKTDIVVLTSTHLFVYDILCSFSAPVLTLVLSEHAELAGKTPCSIAFGSAHNFSGAITLYMSTECGHIYAIYPFLHKGGHFKTSALQLSKLYFETEEALNCVLNDFPPVVTNADVRVAALTKQISFVTSLQNTLAVAMAKELESEGELVWIYSDDTFGYKFQPVAKTGPNPTLVQISSNDELSLVVSVTTASGKTSVTYHGQFHPIIMDWENNAPKLEKPTRPVAVSAKPKHERYAKPARGFGYIIESESEEEDSLQFEAELQAYNNKLDIYNLQQKLNAHCNEEFGTLTTMAVDTLAGDMPIIQATQDMKILLASGGTLYYGDLKNATDSLFRSSAESFTPTYEKFSISPQTTSVAYCEDIINHSGTYAITCSATAKSEVQKIVDKDIKPKPALTNPAITFPSFTPSYIPAEELLVGLNKNTTVDPVKNFDPKSAESLRDIHTTTKNVATQINSLTKFMVSLQMKLKFQVEDLNAQVLDFAKATRGGTKTLDVRTEEKLARLLERQQELSVKLSGINRRTLARFERLKLKIDLPLSKAELDWFRELNVITKTLNYGDNDEQSVSALVEEITEQVAQLTTDDNGGNEVGLKMIELGPELSRVHHFLASETPVISRARAKAQEMVTAVREN